MFKSIRKLLGLPPRQLSTTWRAVYKNFQYISQPKEKYSFLTHDITKPWSGDCDDFAATLAMELPFHSLFAYSQQIPSGTAHVGVLCLIDGELWYADNLGNFSAPAFRTDLRFTHVRHSFANFKVPFADARKLF